MSRIKNYIKGMIAKTGYVISKRNSTKLNDVPNNYEFYLKFTQNDINYYETPIGNYYLPNNAPNDIVINSMKMGKYFEEYILDVAERYIVPNTAVLDVGANLGQMSIQFSKLTGLGGEIYSFEADDYIFDFFLKSIEANKCTNIKPIFGAVYNEFNKILHFPKQDFLKFGAYGSYGLNPQSSIGREVKTITIDSLEIKRPISFMKVDVQGSDLFAMQGAEQTIRRNKMPIIFEFEQQFQKDFNTSFQDYVDFVEHISYKFEEVIGDINYLILPK